MARNESTVVFLGAGASAAFGYPVTAAILPKIVRQWHSKGPLFDEINSPKRSRADRKALRNYVGSLLPGLAHIKSHQLPPITDVFSLVDHAIGNGTAIGPSLSHGEMRHFSELLKQAIFDVIIETWLEESSPSERRAERGFAKWLTEMPNLTVVSTNYDTSVEDILFDSFEYDYDRIASAFDFGFAWRDPDEDLFYPRPVAPQFRLYKLHGSLNRLRCSLCRSTYINLNGAIIHLALNSSIVPDNTCHCGHARLEMDLIAPSLVREMRDPTLIQIWEHAMEALRRASRWIIVGYSLPTEDLAIRDLLLRAYNARPRPPQVNVVQRGSGSRPHYKLLFPRCRFYAGGLSKYLARNS